ncbi:uncharacterized protein knockout [Macrobrachium rosenbergii]|uniref:uncharacterized protein knockout n=1 Tax=Macrobrachium rosenbergii TaxID=79674 RepID=UPI0034D644BB
MESLVKEGDRGALAAAAASSTSSYEAPFWFSSTSMGESLWLHERCLALQLVRNDPPPSRPPKHPHPSCQRTHQRSSSKSSISPKHRTEPSNPSCTSPTAAASPSTDSDTPTPTNGGLPTLPSSFNSNGSSSSTLSHLNKYQDGYLLFQAWQAANTVCVWNTELMFAVREAMYVGLLVGGILLVGGSSKVLATITHAWSRSLLVAPIGFTLAMLGEVSGCKMTAVPQGHFTPLADALCWVIHRLTEGGGTADPETLHSTLNATFPSLTTPDSTIIHATLSSLIHQRKVYHSGRSYGIVQPNTYQLTPIIGASESPCSAEFPSHTFHRGSSHSLLEPASHSSSLGSAHLIVKDGLCHAIVQTNLAELITGATLPTDKIITPRPHSTSRVPHSSLERQASLGMLSSRRNHARTASLRLSPTKVAQLADAFGDTSISKTVCNSNVYEANDMSDITVKVERGSMLTKLLRVSPRRRLASFSAQFPPQEWTDPKASTVHLHSVAVQTSSRQKKDSSDHLWSSLPSWAPRSSTLPRRLRRPLSCTPPLSQNSNPENSSLMQASSHHVLGPETFHSIPHSLVHSTPHVTLMPHPHLSCKGSLDRLQSESSHYFLNETALMPENYRHISRSEHSFDGQYHSLDDSLSVEYGAYHQSGRMLIRKQATEGRTSQHSSPEHHAFGMKPHAKTSRKPPTQGKRCEEGLTRRRGEIHPRKIEESIKGKELTYVHKQKLQMGAKERHHRIHESCCKHRVSEKDKKDDQIHRVSEKDKKDDQIHRFIEKDKKDDQIHRFSEKDKRDDQIHRFSEKDKRDDQIQRFSEKDKRDDQIHRFSEKDKKDDQIHRFSEKDKRDDQIHRFSEKDKRDDQIQGDERLQVTDYDETPVRDLPNGSSVDKHPHNIELQVSENCEESENGEKYESPKPLKKDVTASRTGEQGMSDVPTGSCLQEDNKRYCRSSLQLDLTTLHMNNSKKIISSPHRPEGLKNNMLHDGKGVNDISKGSSHDVNNRNLGYRDIDKCHKQPCSQTLDEAHQVSEPALNVLAAPEEEGQRQNQVSKDEPPKSKTKTHRSPKKKLVTSALKDPNIMAEDKREVSPKAIDNISPDDSNVNAKKVSPDADVASINTYPSLSELNLNFSSLAAQKILHGVSHNSIDTLVEVNLAAEKRKINVKRPEAVTNTDFGFL